MLALIVKAGLAAMLMGGVVWWVASALHQRFGLETLTDQAIVALGSALVGVGIYALCAAILRVPELTAIGHAARRRLGLGMAR